MQGEIEEHAIQFVGFRHLSAYCIYCLLVAGKQEVSVSKRLFVGCKLLFLCLLGLALPIPSPFFYTAGLLQWIKDCRNREQAKEALLALSFHLYQPWVPHSI